jgi:hypothetical protein
MLIAVVSTLISSIALIGVAIGLLLQARQVRASQLQAHNTAQLELIKLAVENPAIAGELSGATDLDAFLKRVYLNWHFSFLSMSYEIRTISDPSLRVTVKRTFTSEFARAWWAYAGPIYQVGATSRRKKKFYVIVDEEFQLASRVTGSAGANAAPPDGSAEFPPQSS